MRKEIGKEKEEGNAKSGQIPSRNNVRGAVDPPGERSWPDDDSSMIPTSVFAPVQLAGKLSSMTDTYLDGNESSQERVSEIGDASAESATKDAMDQDEVSMTESYLHTPAQKESEVKEKIKSLSNSDWTASTELSSSPLTPISSASRGHDLVAMVSDALMRALFEEDSQSTNGIPPLRSPSLLYAPADPQPPRREPDRFIDPSTDPFAIREGKTLTWQNVNLIVVRVPSAYSEYFGWLIDSLTRLLLLADLPEGLKKQARTQNSGQRLG